MYFVYNIGVAFSCYTTTVSVGVKLYRVICGNGELCYVISENGKLCDVISRNDYSEVYYGTSCSRFKYCCRLEMMRLLNIHFGGKSFYQ